MSDINALMARIDDAINAVKDKAKREQQEILQDYKERQKRLAQYEQAQAKVVDIARPRLEALANRAGERVAVTPSVSQTRRAAKLEFKSPVARVVLTFSVAPDRDVHNVVVDCDLSIVPVVVKYDSHAEFIMPIDRVDAEKLAAWLDDQILKFVEAFIRMHEQEVYASAEYVEDPVAKVKFPKFAAGATIEHKGQTYFFIDDQNKQDFARQQGIADS